MSEKNVNKNDNQESICEQYAQLSKESVKKGNTLLAQRYGLKVIDELRSDPSKINGLRDVESVALAMGKAMEGDYFSDNDSIAQAVGLTYYMLCKAIGQSKTHDPYLFVYRFSLVWEYNKAFYMLFAHSEGKEYDPNPINICSNVSLSRYVNNVNAMVMADMFLDMRIARMRPALANIFNEIYSRYNSPLPPQIISIGNQYHEQIFTYIEKKISNLDIDF